MDARIDLTGDRLFRSSRHDNSYELHEEMPFAEWIEDSILAPYEEFLRLPNPRYHVLYIYQIPIHDFMRDIRKYGLSDKVYATDFHEFMRKMSTPEKVLPDENDYVKYSNCNEYIVSYNEGSGMRNSWTVDYGGAMHTRTSMNRTFTYAGTGTGSTITILPDAAERLAKKKIYKFGEQVKPKYVTAFYLDSKINLTDQLIRPELLAELIEWDNPEILDELNHELRQFTFRDQRTFRISSDDDEIEEWEDHALRIYVANNTLTSTTSSSSLWMTYI